MSLFLVLINMKVEPVAPGLFWVYGNKNKNRPCLFQYHMQGILQKGRQYNTFAVWESIKAQKATQGKKLS
jgi:hypothetical protein